MPVIRVTPYNTQRDRQIDKDHTERETTGGRFSASCIRLVRFRTARSAERRGGSPAFDRAHERRFTPAGEARDPIEAEIAGPEVAVRLAASNRAGEFSITKGGHSVHPVHAGRDRRCGRRVRRACRSRLSGIPDARAGGKSRAEYRGLEQGRPRETGRLRRSLSHRRIPLGPPASRLMGLKPGFNRFCPAACRPSTSVR